MNRFITLLRAHLESHESETSDHATGGMESEWGGSPPASPPAAPILSCGVPPRPMPPPTSTFVASPLMAAVNYAWEISHRNWNKPMHALHGNTAIRAEGQAETMTRVPTPVFCLLRLSDAQPA